VSKSNLNVILTLLQMVFASITYQAVKEEEEQEHKGDKLDGLKVRAYYTTGQHVWGQARLVPSSLALTSQSKAVVAV